MVSQKSSEYIIVKYEGFIITLIIRYRLFTLDDL